MLLPQMLNTKKVYLLSSDLPSGTIELLEAQLEFQ